MGTQPAHGGGACGERGAVHVGLPTRGYVSVGGRGCKRPLVVKMSQLSYREERQARNEEARKEAEDE